MNRLWSYQNYVEHLGHPNSFVRSWAFKAIETQFPRKVTKEVSNLIGEASGELDAYFAGELRQFSVPLDLRGTDFQRRVWELLRGIPYGETRSHSQIASRHGSPQGRQGRRPGQRGQSCLYRCSMPPGHRSQWGSGRLWGRSEAKKDPA